MPTPPHQYLRLPSAKGRKLLLACVVTLVLLGLLELGARVAAGPPETPPLLRVRALAGNTSLEQSGRKVTAGFQRGSTPISFDSAPASHVPRVAFLGGSSVHGGSGIDLTLEFPARVQALLAEHGVAIEALNLGSPGLDSAAIRNVASNLVPHRPSLLVIYTGHNDLGNTVQEQRYGSVSSALVVRLRLLLWRCRAYGLLRDLLVDSPAAAVVRPVKGADARNPISHAQRLLAAAALRDNLQAVVRQARDAGAAVVLVTPISNIQACGPVGYGCPGALPDLESGDRKNRVIPTAERLAAIEQALVLHPDCPELLHQRGLVRIALGIDGGPEDLLRSRELDPLPMRATSDMTQAVRAAARAEGARLVDLERDLHAQYGVPPTVLFHDCLHFTVDGHDQMATWLAPEVLAALEL